MLSNITFAPRDNSNVTTATQPTNSANLELYANLSVELLPHEKKGKRDKLAWDFQIEKRLRLKCVLNLKRLDFGTDAELFLPTLLMTPKSNWIRPSFTMSFSTDAKPPVPVIKSTDMNEDMQSIAFQIAIEALNKFKIEKVRSRSLHQTGVRQKVRNKLALRRWS
uniref:Ribosomal protein S10 n=1 Tax=Panagrellus redivivus TaxID=6233 RepID=A0A7E4VL32_PANRE